MRFAGDDWGEGNGHISISCLGAGKTLAAWNELVDRYFDDHFEFNPTDGTFQGFHQYDRRLEDFSATAVQKETASMHSWEKCVEAFDHQWLDETNAADRELLLGSIRSRLLSLETIREWEKNPDNYSSGVTQSAFYLMMRKFASPDERLHSLVAREKQMPAVFAAA